MLKKSNAIPYTIMERISIHRPEPGSPKPNSPNRNTQAKGGIFYSYIYLKKDEEIIRIDTRTSDAVGMAIRAECPILIYESILEQECLRISNEERRHPEESDEEAEDEKKRDLPRNVTSMSLEEALDQAIKDENYELAAKIRDRINSRNQNH